MKYSGKARKISLIVGLAIVLSLLTLDSSPVVSSSTGSINHVIFIMMENQNYRNIVGSSNAPYINSLVAKYAVATNYYGVQYPSLPNYIDVTSGSDGGITSDCGSGPSPGGCETSNTNIFSLLQSNHLTWKAYEESMPSNCYTSDYGNLNSGGYIVHHDPIPYLADLSSVCSQDDVPLGNVNTQTGAFFTALGSDSLPTLSFITPNSCDDMHSCGMSPGDSWLAKIIPDIINSPSYSSTIVIITWDTGNCVSPCNQNKNGGGQVLTIVVGPSNLVAPGKYSSFYNHYSTLATVESIFGLGNLGRNDASATPLTAMLASSGTTTTTSTTTDSSSTTVISTSSTTSSSSTSESSTSLSTTNDTSTSNGTSTSLITDSSTSLTQTKSSTSHSTPLTNSSTALNSTKIAPAVNPVVGLLSALAPAKDPSLAFGIGIYEIPLLGALGYILVNLRSPKFWPLSAQKPSLGMREAFWRNGRIHSSTRRRRKNDSITQTFGSVHRAFWKVKRKKP